ncbi:trypsin-like peptidase domain-containing protein [Streptomyces sp. NPDC050504]|uniref:VMAP-C domain-containing protein n=1 Tax=Streptomyces sp. NPDC050504 TaxID=3365618 RepID=UPI00378A63E4
MTSGSSGRTGTPGRPGHPGGSAGPAWHVRVECGPEVGAGFLVSERHVLTCAHVVRYDDGATVALANSGRPEPLSARVVARGTWQRETDPGDVAVLELDAPVSGVPAARFADPGDAYARAGRDLVAYGFPVGFDEGALAKYRPFAGQLIADEWVHLEAVSGHGQPLAEGFSGSAAVIEGTGLVAGMVTSIAADPGVRTGRMLPVQVLVRYWPPLADLVPTPGYERAEKTELRELVARVEEYGHAECRADELYAHAAGGLAPEPPPGGFRTLWDALWFLLSEVSAGPDADPAARFAERLAAHVADPELRLGLRSWARGRTGGRDGGARRSTTGRTAGDGTGGNGTAGNGTAGDGTPGGAAAGAVRPWSPILVEIDHSGADRGVYLVEVSACHDRGRRVVGTGKLPKRCVKPRVREWIGDAYWELAQDGRDLIAFVLPRAWLNEPVDRWPRAKGDTSPIGLFSPVVVMDLERRRDGALQRRLKEKWQLIDRQPAGLELRAVACGDTRSQPLLGRLRRGCELAGFPGPPRAGAARRLLEAGLNAPSPALLWSRTGCRGDHAADAPCPGDEFLRELARRIEGTPAAELPDAVLRLREEAADAEASGEAAHWARDLTLLWEDPRWFPETTGYRRPPTS